MATDRANEARNLLEVKTKHYEPPLISQRWRAVGSINRPIFYRWFIPEMMRDPHLWYGMQILKGPVVSKSKFRVNCEDIDVKNYIIRQITRFWTAAIDKALQCLDWGAAGCEVIYKFDEFNQQIIFDNLRYIHFQDARVITNCGNITHMEVRHPQIQGNPASVEYLSRPKFLWTIHDKIYNPWYGKSRLEGAFDTWYEIWQNNGYRAIRHLWFYKNAFNSGDIHFPPGATQDADGNETPNAQIAQEILDMRETGAAVAFPKNSDGTLAWELTYPEGNDVPEGLLEYGDVLRDELWEGIGVPPEVAKSEGTGSFAGRRVPQQAFYSYLQEIGNSIIYAFDDQVLRNLVHLAYGPVEYTIEPISILETLQAEEMGLVTGQVNESGGNEESEEGPSVMDDGRVEDRDSNGFNIQEQAQAS